MTMAFRSVVVALKAAVTTLLSALAAFGALVAVFEWGWLQGLVGLDTTGPTASFLPVIVLSILFGLAMDYEVFLASRIREEYVKDGDARGSITRGVNGVGRVIVAAAIIMGVVFWAFVLSDDRTVKSFGLGLGVAILVDALIIRMLMVPAVMHLLGKRAWYIPRWLDRILPNLTIEPPDEDEETDGRAPTDRPRGPGAGPRRGRVVTAVMPASPERARTDARPARGGLLVVGGGFAGASLARMAGRAGATIVSPENFMLYTPLLPDVAAGTVEPRHVVMPLRQMCPHADLILGAAAALDEDGPRADGPDRHRHGRCRRTTAWCWRPAPARARCRFPGSPSERSASRRSRTRCTCATRCSTASTRPTPPRRTTAAAT